MSYKSRLNYKRQNNFSLVNVGTVNAKANLALGMVADLASKLNVEYKYHDASVTGYITYGSPTILCLTGIDQGDTETTRDGNQCKMVSLSCRWTITPNAASDKTVVRAIIVMDTETQSGATFGITDLLDTGTGTSFPNYDNRRRFKILWDKLFVTGGNADIPKAGKYYMKRTLTLNYDGSSYTNTVNNHLYLVLISNEDTNTPAVTWKNRIRFLDN